MYGMGYTNRDVRHGSETVRRQVSVCSNSLGGHFVKPALRRWESLCVIGLLSERRGTPVWSLE